MKLIICLKSKQEVELKLENGDTMDMLIIPLDFHFDTVLVTSIDKLFKRNRILRVSPLEIVLEGFEDQSSMAYLIAKTVTEALKTK